MPKPSCDRNSLICPYAANAQTEIELLRFALATVLGTGTDGLPWTWATRCRIGRLALDAIQPN